MLKVSLHSQPYTSSSPLCFSYDFTLFHCPIAYIPQTENGPLGFYSWPMAEPSHFTMARRTEALWPPPRLSSLSSHRGKVIKSPRKYHFSVSASSVLVNKILQCITYMVMLWSCLMHGYFFFWLGFEFSYSLMQYIQNVSMVCLIQARLVFKTINLFSKCFQALLHEWSHIIFYVQ